MATPPRFQNATILRARCGARYWEDATVDGVEDTDGTLIPCRKGNDWCPDIDIATGRILNWTPGVSASLHYKVCDDGTYTLLDANGATVEEIDGYVPTVMSPKKAGYGDYIIMDIGQDGVIAEWRPDLSCFDD